MYDRLCEIRNLIDRAAQAYYYGQPIITDEAFDALMVELKQLDGSDHRLTRVGYPVDPACMLTKVKHTKPLTSLDKVDDVDALRKWLIGCKTPKFIVQHKLDGASLVIYYVGGKLHKAVTRGGDDGYGEDVTANAVMFKNVLMTLSTPITIAIRGEVILRTEQYKVVDPTLSGNARNVGNGIMRRSDGVNSNLLEFVPFDCDDYLLLFEHQKVDLMLELGFNVVETSLVENVDDAIKIYNDVGEQRDSLPYKIDGIVFKIDDIKAQHDLGVSGGRPRGQMVLKYQAMGAITTVKDVVVTIGHTGVLVPTAVLEPVLIDGTHVQNALLNNWNFIAALDVAIGDKVEVIKAKDIIPYVTRVIERAVDRKPIEEPSTCPVCGFKTGRSVNVDGIDGASTMCLNDSCEAKGFARIKKWINKLDVLGIGDTVLMEMFKTGKLQQPADLYNWTIDQLAALRVGNGDFGVSRATQVYDQLHNKKSLSLKKFLGSLSVPYLGERRVELLQAAVPGKMTKIEDWLNVDNIALLEANGAPKIASHIINGIIVHKSTIDELLKHVTIVDDEPVQASSDKFAGLTFVFTGAIMKCDGNGKRYTRDALHNMVRGFGGNVSDDVKKGVNYLVQADPNSVSSKSQKAVKFDVKIISENEFFDMVG